jgi:hypothetical protein
MGTNPHINRMREYKVSKPGFRFCSRCKKEHPATLEFFVKDSSRRLGISYECKPCHSKRKIGRDRRKERWSNSTPEQKILIRERQRRYGKTPKGRAIFLRKAYQRIDSCDLSVDEVMEIVSQPCVHCGTTQENRGLDRIDNSLPHIKGNVAPSCAPCNFARGNRFSFEEMKIIGATIKKVLMDRLSAATENEGHPGKIYSAFEK